MLDCFFGRGKWVMSLDLMSLVLLICSFFFAGYDEPYLLALLTDCIEIRTVEPCLFIQSMTVPKPRLVVRCRQGLVYIASVDHVWRLQAVPLARQIHVLLEDKQFQLALKLTVCIIIIIRLCMRRHFDYTGWPQFIHHISRTHKIWSIQNTENWCALLGRTTHQVQYFSTRKTICSSYNVQTVLEFMPCVFQHLGCQEKLHCWFMHKVQLRGQLLDRIPGPLYRNCQPSLDGLSSSCLFYIPNGNVFAHE